MKILKYTFAILIVAIAFVRCSDDKTDDLNLPNPVEDLYKIYEFQETDHVVEIYSEKTALEVGYNEISIRIKDLASDKYITNATPTWMPMMHMESMQHSAPHSSLDNAENNSVYSGYIVFQMPNNETEYWDITLNFNLNGQALSETYSISVAQPADGLKKTQVFMGSDNNKYVLAFVNPKEPEVAINDMQAVLYKMVDMMTFTVVENYTITLDPRMPGMNNHSSPNNEDLTYGSATKMYNGKLSLTMTGYWKINLKLLDESGTILKGEDVTESHPESSLYFELEF